MRRGITGEALIRSVLDRYEAREIVLRYAPERDVPWSAEAFPTREHITRRLGLRVFIEWFLDCPVAYGQGPTQTEAIASMLPLKWTLQ
jgi:hypothetical protein